MKSKLFDFLVALGCVALISYADRKGWGRRRSEEKLDSSLMDTFPASDPISY
jgi:hypothetical protein